MSAKNPRALNTAVQSLPTNQLTALLDPVGNGPTEVSHPVVSTILLHTYPTVGSTLTKVCCPVVSTLVLHTYPAVGALGGQEICR